MNDKFARGAQTQTQAPAYPPNASTSSYPRNPYPGYAARQGNPLPGQNASYAQGVGANDNLASGYSRTNNPDYGSYPQTSLAPESRLPGASVPRPGQRNKSPSGPSNFRNNSNRPPTIQFKAKSPPVSGITLDQAISGAVKMSGEHIGWREINADASGNIVLRVEWPGYAARTYGIPVDARNDRVRRSSLARRVGRACVHFMQESGIRLSSDRIKLYNIEEVSRGVWQPSLEIR